VRLKISKNELFNDYFFSGVILLGRNRTAACYYTPQNEALTAPSFSPSYH